ncbi:MAG: histidine kinase [Rhodocyclaceae bacterium]|nr:histidine kinase [Rhodocyclaceae bacterium]
MSPAPLPLRLLYVAAASVDPQAFLLALGLSSQRVDLRHISSAPLLRTALAEPPWDATLYVPGAALAVQTVIKLIDELGLDLPVLMIANADERKLALGAMKAGARDVIDADRLERLLPAIEREADGAQHRADHRAALEMLRDSEARFRGLASNLPGMLFQLRRSTVKSASTNLADDESPPTYNFRFMYVSDGCQKLFGRKQHELLESAEYFFSAFDAKQRKSLELALKESAISGTLFNWEGHAAGRSRAKWISLRSTPHRFEDGSVEWQGIATNVTHSKEAEGELRRSREQLAELSTHLEAVKEEERERIARDIHDELGSILVRLKIEVALLSSKLPAEAGALRVKAQSIEGLLNQAMGTTSRVARELRPGILKEFGLPAAIECQAEDFSQRSGTQCLVHCDDDDKAMKPDSEASIAIFRIAQEALTNIAKHAQATQVNMRLSRFGGNIVLDIHDNGKGISDDDLSKPKSFGLRGIRERVLSLAGEFSIVAADTGGTQICLRIPEHISAESERQDEQHREQQRETQRKLF